MKVLFVQSYKENLGVEYLSAYVKTFGHEVELFFDPRIFDNCCFHSEALKKIFNTDKLLSAHLARFEPDVVAFSVYTHDFQWALNKAQLIKKDHPRIPIIFGGIHPTLCPDVVISKECVDVVCIGEGEVPLLRYVENHSKPDFDYQIPNLWIKNKNGVIKNSPDLINKDLDALPFPDKELYYNQFGHFKKTYLMLAARGCCFHCAYCSNNALHKIYKGTNLRKRSVDNVIAELKIAKRKHSPKMIDMADNIFGVGDNQYTKELLTEYQKEVGLPLVLSTHSSFLTDEICALLKRANCIFVEIGVQSVDEAYRRNILHRPEKNSAHVQACALLKKHKIPFTLDHIFNMPLEDEKTYKDAVLFYNELRPNYVNTFWLQYFPGTDMTRFALENGILSKEEEAGFCEGTGNVYATVGLGRDNSRNKRYEYYNFQFWMDLMPLVPKKLFKRLFNKFYRWPKRCPNLVLGCIKFFGRLKNRSIALSLITDEFVFHLLGVLDLLKRKMALRFFRPKA